MLGGLIAAQVGLPWTGYAATALLAAFTVWLMTHRGVPCACFGVWSRRPVGWTDVARNIALLALTALVIAQH